jgi:flagellar hook-basal body complex protein FliE
MAIDPSFAVRGAEWAMGGISDPGQAASGAGAAGSASSTSFGSMLSNQISSLEATQQQAADAAVSLADGTATDPSSVVMAVERARLSMQLASQVRTKAVESLQDIFHTQI